MLLKTISAKFAKLIHKRIFRLSYMVMENPNQMVKAKTYTTDTRSLRILKVLELVVSTSQPITASQLVMRSQIPKATIARIIDLLLEKSYIMSIAGEKGFVPGPKLTNIALETIGNNAFKRSCRAVLRSLVQLLGETCNLTTLDGDRVIHIERVETHEPLRLNLETGSRHPMHCTAGGKLFLAQMNLYERKQFLDRLDLVKMTPNTITNRHLLEEELNRLKIKMIGEDREEYVRGMVGIAVPVLNSNGKVIAALVCHTATARMNLQQLTEFLPKMHTAAEQLTELFTPNTELE